MQEQLVVQILNFSLICFDLVSIPSTRNAFLRISEGKHIDGFDPSKVLPPKYRIKEILEDLLKK